MEKKIIKNKDDGVFIWCNSKYLHVTDQNPRRIINLDNNLMMVLYWCYIFYGLMNIGNQNETNIWVFGYKNRLVYQI